MVGCWYIFEAYGCGNGECESHWSEAGGELRALGAVGWAVEDSVVGGVFWEWAQRAGS